MERKKGMIQKLKMGDRVRVRRPVRGYQVGEKGTVLDGPTTPAGAAKTYVVMMDKDGPGATSIVFAEADIELDQ
jgi:hypothetical protein